MRRTSLLLAVLLSGCGGGAIVTPNFVAGTELGTGSSGLGRRQDELVGVNTAASLKSLKYAIKELRLCEDVQRSGSGYSGTSGCVSLYTAANIPDDNGFYEGYMLDQALADTTAGRYVDLVSAEGQAQLRQPTSVPAGTYRYGMVDFLRPIKVSAEFPVLGASDQVVYTKANTGKVPRPSDGPFQNEAALIGDSLTGPAEETTYMLNNGGSFFSFAEPFVVTPEQASSGAALKMDLVFNPDALGKAISQPNCMDDVVAPICDLANGIAVHMPFVHINPVPRAAGEQTRKEVYLVEYTPTTKVRVELYYNGSDPQKSVRGVDVATVYEPGVTDLYSPYVASDVFAQGGTVSGGDAVVSLKNYLSEDSLTGILRGASGTATLHPQGQQPVQRPYTFVGDLLVSGD